MRDQYTKIIQKYYISAMTEAEIIETWEPTNVYVDAGLLGASTVSDKIRAHLVKSMQHGYITYTFPRGKVQITIPATFKVKMSEIISMMRRAYIMRKICRSHSKVSILYFPTDFKKKLPKTRKPLSSHHVNSGVTDLGLGVILIFRREDSLKVLLHELIHYFGMDQPYIRYNIQPSLYFMYQKNVNDLLVDEVLTETMAFIWNIAITAMELGLDPSVVYQTEVEHGIKQSAKILKYFGFKSIDEFNRGCCQGNRPIIEVTTPAVVEYYIMRTALMFNLERAHIAIMDPTMTMGMLMLAFDDPEFRMAIDAAIENGECSRDLRSWGLSLHQAAGAVFSRSSLHQALCYWL